MRIINKARKAAADQLEKAAAMLRPQEFTDAEKKDITAVLIIELEEQARAERKAAADKMNKAIGPVVLKFRPPEDPAEHKEQEAKQ